MGDSAERRSRSSNGETVAFGFYALQRWEHQGKRFFLTLLAFAQEVNGFFVARVGHQMKSAESLDGDNFSGANGFGGGAQARRSCARQSAADFLSRKVGGVLPNAATPQFQMRAANRTGIGLRMKPAVARVVVFRPALRAHREFFHRGVRAVVGQRFNDAEARAAVGAIGKRITVATIFRIEDFAETIRTRGNVRQHQRGLVAAGFARPDFKILETNRVEPRGFKALDETVHGFFGFEPEQKFFKRGARAFNFDENALRRIVDPAGQSAVRWRAGRRTDGSQRPAPRRERRASAGFFRQRKW